MQVVKKGGTVMTVEYALRLARQWSQGHICTLREGEAKEYHKLVASLLEDVAPVRHGTWKLKMVGAFGDLKQYSCSECGFSLLLNPTKIPPYCEDCGAKMSLEEVQDG